jgi:hypothetical protein
MTIHHLADFLCGFAVRMHLCGDSALAAPAQLGGTEPPSNSADNSNLGSALLRIQWKAGRACGPGIPTW